MPALSLDGKAEITAFLARLVFGQDMRLRSGSARQLGVTARSGRKIELDQERRGVSGEAAKRFAVTQSRRSSEEML